LIEQYGWSDALRWPSSRTRAGHVPGRVIVQQRDAYLVVTDEGELTAKLSGRLRHEAREAGHPAVGDWVALSPNLVDGARHPPRHPAAPHRLRAPGGRQRADGCRSSPPISTSPSSSPR
jgi:hypothetical protein